MICRWLSDCPPNFAPKIGPLLKVTKLKVPRAMQFASSLGSEFLFPRHLRFHEARARPVLRSRNSKSEMLTFRSRDLSAYVDDDSHFWSTLRTFPSVEYRTGSFLQIFSNVCWLIPRRMNSRLGIFAMRCN